MTGRKRRTGTTTSCVSLASRTELRYGDEGGRPASSVSKGQTTSILLQPYRVCIQSQISKLHPVQKADQIKRQASHLPRTNETVLFLPAVLHKDCGSEDSPIRDTSCQLSLVSWLASGTAPALHWSQSLMPADAACEEMVDGKGLTIHPTPHIEPPTPTSTTTVKGIRKPGSGTTQTLRHAYTHV